MLNRLSKIVEGIKNQEFKSDAHLLRVAENTRILINGL